MIVNKTVVVNKETGQYVKTFNLLTGNIVYTNSQKEARHFSVWGEVSAVCCLDSNLEKSEISYAE